MRQSPARVRPRGGQRERGVAANGDVVKVREDSRLSVIDAVLHFVGAHVVRRIHVRRIELAGVVPGYRRARCSGERKDTGKMYIPVSGSSWSRSRPKSALSFARSSAWWASPRFGRRATCGGGHQRRCSARQPVRTRKRRAAARARARLCRRNVRGRRSLGTLEARLGEGNHRVTLLGGEEVVDDIHLRWWRCGSSPGGFL